MCPKSETIEHTFVKKCLCSIEAPNIYTVQKKSTPPPFFTINLCRSARFKNVLFVFAIKSLYNFWFRILLSNVLNVPMANSVPIGFDLVG